MLKTPARRAATALAGAIVLTFIAVVAALWQFHPEGAGFEQRGLPLLTYNICRLALVFFVLVLCYTAGYRTLQCCGINPSAIFASYRRLFILCFFLGATVYGVVFTVIGLAGALNSLIALTSTIPVLAFSIRPLQQLTTSTRNFLHSLWTQSNRLGRAFFSLHAAALVVALGLFLSMEVVFIATTEPNVWEHYLHYYRKVLELGSTQPNEVWHHFFASKAAGVILLTNELSDFFGAPIASAAFALAAAVVIADLVIVFCGAFSWALLAVSLFLFFIGGDWAAAVMFRHHVAVLGYVSFALWSTWYITRQAHDSGLESRCIVVVSALASAYAAFYVPLLGMIFPTAFLFVAITDRALVGIANFRSLGFLASAGLVGLLGSFLLNWAMTGTPDITPMRLLWQIADHDKVARTFGLGGIEYFLRINNDVGDTQGWVFHPSLMWEFLRYPLPRGAAGTTVILMIFLLIVEFRSKSERSTARVLTHLLAFILPLGLIAEVFQSIAVVHRAGLFSIVMTIVGSVVIWKRSWDLIPESSRTNLKLPEGWSGLTTRELIAQVIIAAALIQGFKTAATSIGRDVLHDGRRFIFARISLKDAFTQLEPLFTKANVGVQGAIRVADMLEYRKHMHAGERMLRLTYDGGYSNALPGAGIVSEPTYAVVDDPERLLAAKPDEVASYLRARGFAHFIFNVQAPLFSTVAFTSLFDPREISNFLRVSFSDGDIFILTWREGTEKERIPTSLVQALDFKRASILQQPFSRKFAERITGNSERLVSDYVAFDEVRRSLLADLQAEFTRFSGSLSTDDARRTLHYMWDRVAQDYSDDLAIKQIIESRCWSAECRGDEEKRDLAKFLPEKEVKKRLLMAFLKGLRKEYEHTFGAELAEFFESYDESEPFGPRRVANAAGKAF